MWSKSEAREEVLVKIEPFFVVVLDHDKKEFNIAGLLSDDTAITNNVADAQKAGRNVNCYTPSRDFRLAALIEEVERAHGGYSYTSFHIVPDGN